MASFIEIDLASQNETYLYSYVGTGASDRADEVTYHYCKKKKCSAHDSANLSVSYRSPM